MLDDSLLKLDLVPQFCSDLQASRTKFTRNKLLVYFSYSSKQFPLFATMPGTVLHRSFQSNLILSSNTKWQKHEL